MYFFLKLNLLGVSKIWCLLIGSVTIWTEAMMTGTLNFKLEYKNLICNLKIPNKEFSAAVSIAKKKCFVFNLFS